MKRILLAAAVMVAVAGCTGGAPVADSQESVTSVTADSTETTAAAEEVEAPADAERLPSGALYAPSSLPDGWRIQSMRLFAPGHEVDVGSSSYMVHRSEGGYELGGLTLSITTYATVAEASEASKLGTVGFGHGRPIEVAGVEGAQLEEDPTTDFRWLSGVVDGVHVAQWFGSLPLSDFRAVAEAVSIDTSSQPVLDAGLDGWEISPLGMGGETYELGLVGPAGSLSVSVAPGRTQAALYQNGTDFESELTGETGTGYYAVQRIESGDFEFPSVRWWVPDAYLFSSTGPDLEIVADILDGFGEVDAAKFAELVSEATVEVIEIEASAPEGGPAEGEPVDPAVRSRLVAFIESHVGRKFETVPEVTVVAADELRASVPDGAFVSETLWDVLLTLGLVDETDDRLAADAVRRERVRGVCCPVSVVDTGDPLFNEVVLVHELTHGLDTEINSSGSGSNEPVDSVVALIEGNAHRVAFDYAEVLNRQGADIAIAPNLFPAGGDPRLPDPVQQILEFPYDEGRLFAAALVDTGGEQAIIDAFSRPPTTSEQILDVDAFLADEQPTVVDAPVIPQDANKRQQGSLGSFLITLLTDQELGTDRALELALTWAGDTYTLYDHGTDICISALAEFDTETDVRTFAESIQIAGADIALNQTEVSIINCVQAPE